MNMQKKTIVILEDHPMMVMALMTALRSWRKLGWQLILCQNQIAARRHKKAIASARVILLDRDCPIDEVNPDCHSGSFHHEIPEGSWSRTVSISGEKKWNLMAESRGARAIFEKDWSNPTHWAESIVAFVKEVI